MLLVYISTFSNWACRVSRSISRVLPCDFRGVCVVIPLNFDAYQIFSESIKLFLAKTPILLKLLYLFYPFLVKLLLCQWKYLRFFLMACPCSFYNVAPPHLNLIYKHHSHPFTIFSSSYIYHKRIQKHIQPRQMFTNLAKTIALRSGWRCSCTMERDLPRPRHNEGAASQASWPRG